MDKVGVVIVDDHPIVREQLAELINREKDIYVCGQADNIRDGFEVIKRGEAQVAIVDISLKGSSGLELIKNLKKASLNVPVLVLSMHEESLYAERALHSGAKGYITKHAESTKVMFAIRQILAGEIYLAPHVTSNILSKLSTGELVKTGVSLLADRELEVFDLIGQGCTTREIASRLGLGSATVDTYKGRIKEKLGLQNATQLSAEATCWATRSRYQ